MKFIAYDPYLDPSSARELDVELTDLDTVFRDSDFLSVNVPLSDETYHLVNYCQAPINEAKRLSNQYITGAGGRSGCPS